jgi:hypothetical protein
MSGSVSQIWLPSRNGQFRWIQQPAKDVKSPSGEGRVGVKGWKAKACEVSKPAFLAVPKSTKGKSALTA